VQDAQPVELCWKAAGGGLLGSAGRGLLGWRQQVWTILKPNSREVEYLFPAEVWLFARAADSDQFTSKRVRAVNLNVSGGSALMSPGSPGARASRYKVQHG
jgi:hypothetical protein